MGIRSRISGIFSPSPVSKDIELSMYNLRCQLNKMDEIYERMSKREKELLDTCVSAQMGGDQNLANLYATECAEVRKIVRSLLRSKLALEQTILRLRTSEKLGAVFSEMQRVNRIISSTNIKVGAPMVIGQGIEDMQSILQTVLPEEQEPIQVITGDVSNILNEVKAIVDARISEKFPKIPEEVQAQQKSEEVSTPTATDGGKATEKEIEDYFQACGELNIYQCALDIGCSPDVVEKVARELKNR